MWTAAAFPRLFALPGCSLAAARSTCGWRYPSCQISAASPTYSTRDRETTETTWRRPKDSTERARTPPNVRPMLSVTFEDLDLSQ